jgi:hypothetical protein
MNCEIEVRTVGLMLSRCAIYPATTTDVRSFQIDVDHVFHCYAYCTCSTFISLSDPTGNGISLSAAIARISSVIFIEQYLGPHMLQKWALLKS